MNPLPSHHSPMETSRGQCNFQPQQLLQGNLSSKSNFQTFTEEQNPQVSEPPPQTAQPPCKAASHQPPFSQCCRRSLGVHRRMGRGELCRATPLLSSSSTPCPSLFSVEGVLCPGPTGRVTLCQGTARSLLCHNEPLHVNSTWWNQK